MPAAWRFCFFIKIIVLLVCFKLYTDQKPCPLSLADSNEERYERLVLGASGSLSGHRKLSFLGPKLSGFWKLRFYLPEGPIFTWGCENLWKWPGCKKPTRTLWASIDRQHLLTVHDKAEQQAPSLQQLYEHQWSWLLKKIHPLSRC